MLLTILIKLCSNPGSASTCFIVFLRFGTSFITIGWAASSSSKGLTLKMLDAYEVYNRTMWHTLRFLQCPLHHHPEVLHILLSISWEIGVLTVELGLCNLSLEFSLTHVVVTESSSGWPWWSIVDLVVLWGWLVTMTWGGRYIKFIVWLNPTRLDSSVVRASGICPEGLGSIPSLVTFLYSNTRYAAIALLLLWAKHP